ncbi:hypothetical protein [Hyphomonas sp.]|uniref:hypothetical protein n=1 Tax=Hyphomonas sp. TaxID=87 RepID=UPI003003907A
MTDETATADAEPIAETIEVAEPSTARGSIDSAFDSVFGSEGDEDTPAPEGEAAELTEAAAPREDGRDAQGRFKAKETADNAPEVAEDADKPEAEPAAVQGHEAPPERFSPAAKEAWAQAPETVRAEVHRAVTELQQGLDKYKADSDNWNEISEFKTLADQHGVNMKDMMTNYVTADQRLGKDLVGGLDHIAQQYGYSLRQIAEHVLGQPVDQQQGQQDQVIRELRAEIGQLKQQVSGVNENFATHQRTSIDSMVTGFASENPRFTELQPVIAEMIQTGFAKGDTPEARLKDAYEKADRLNPAPKAPDVPTPAKSAQTTIGNLSVTGAPGAGSNPATRKPAASTRDALDRAFDVAGL